MRWQLHIVLLSLIASLIVVRPSVAEAAGPEELFRAGDEVTIAAEETVPHDLFVAGQTIRIDGVVKGDVVAAGRRVVINGTIEGDLWAAAESVEVNGQVQGDLRVLSNKVSLIGHVGRNVLAGAGDVEIQTQGRVGGDLVSFSDQTLINGDVQGDVSGKTERYQRTGTVGGQELIEVG